MMRKNKNYYIRRVHRYLGVVLGLQFFMWTLGGLYFSWNDIDKVHGDHLRKDKKYLPADLILVSPQVVVQHLKAATAVDSIQSLQLIEIEGKPVYQVRYFSGSKLHSEAHGGGHGEATSTTGIQLASAETGELRAPLDEKEAVRIAKSNLKDPVQLDKVEYLTSAGSHHEYRGKPLPAWAVTFSKPDNCTVYISSELGTFQSIRHNQWRVFDFLWMLHTMDYQGRDNFGNILLKAFSIFGIFTILSGFILYFVSSPTINRQRRKKAKQLT